MPRADRTATVVFGVLWLVYAGVIIYAATMPFRFTDDQQIVQMKLEHISPDPLADTWAQDRGGWVSAANVGLDVAFFLPFGAFGGLTERRATKWTPLRRVLIVTVLGFFLSTAVETVQVFTRDRIPSSADVAANTMGALAGAWIALRKAS